MKFALLVLASAFMPSFTYAQETPAPTPPPRVYPVALPNYDEETATRLQIFLDNSDFGVFIFSADDVIRMRKKEYSAVRDNVIFELGLFVGRLGKGRNFILLPRGEDKLHIPTDLMALTTGTFDPNRSDKNLTAALGSASLACE